MAALKGCGVKICPECKKEFEGRTYCPDCLCLLVGEEKKTKPIWWLFVPIAGAAGLVQAFVGFVQVVLIFLFVVGLITWSTPLMSSTFQWLIITAAIQLLVLGVAWAAGKVSHIDASGEGE